MNKEPQEQADFDRARAEMQAGFKEAGIATREQVLELIQDVKKEMFRERLLKNSEFELPNK